VTDTASDLPDELVLQYDIGLVPTQLIVEERSYRDRFELTSGEFFRRLRAGLDASTSQPAPQAFTDAYQDAARRPITSSRSSCRARCRARSPTPKPPPAASIRRA